MCRDRTYDPVIKSRIGIFGYAKAFLHILPEPAYATSVSHLLYQLVLQTEGLHMSVTFASVYNVKKLRVLLVISLTLGLATVEASNSFADEMPTIQKSGLWYIGNDAIGYSCWDLKSKKQKVTLQVKIDGRWINKARATIYKEPTMCPDSNYPWVALYAWQVDEFGEYPNPNYPRALDIMVREYVGSYAGVRARAGRPFIKTIYRDQGDMQMDFLDTLNKWTQGKP